MAPGAEHPQSVGPFRVEGVLGSGGMGVVYRGAGPDGTPVAIKVIRASFESQGAIRRFEREARVRISHPNVVRVLDAGMGEGDTPYIAFELLEGESLAERLGRGTLAIDEVIDLGLGLLAGLAAAHREGVVHRDLKPANIFITDDGTPKILDFGVARLAAAATQLTEAGKVVGTLSYLSPEQAEGRPLIDERSDVFSLGAVLYECLVGQAPFSQESPLATVVATLLSDPSPIHLTRPEVPAALEAAILRSLEKDRGARFQNASAFADALADAARDARGAPGVEGERGRRAPDTIPPGEQRVVAVLLAKGVHDHPKLAAAIREEGGRALPLIGDRLLGLFGAETTAGDELLRAAAVALRSRGYAERIAIGAGRASGSGAGITGSALDEAESASAHILPGVAISAEAARGLPRGVPLTPVTGSLFELAAQTRILDVLDARREETPLVGREVEVALLERTLDAALTERRATVAAILGPQGIGKSRLRGALEAAVAEDAAAPRVFIGRADPHRGGRSLSVFRSLLGHALSGGEPDARNDQLATLVGAVVTDDMATQIVDDLALLVRETAAGDRRFSLAATDIRQIDDRLRRSILTWLEAACRKGPVVLIVEDLSFADPESIDVLCRLVERCYDAPLFVFASSRPALFEERPDLFSGSELVRIDLKGLGRAAVGALAERIAKGPVPKDLVARLHERTAGNPLFVEQIVADLVERGAIGADIDALPIPLTVEAAVQSRLDHLPSAEKELCKRVAIYQRSFTRDDVAAVGTIEPDLLLRSLRRRDVIAPRGAGRFDFRSSLTREVAYRMLADDLRRELHGLAAAHLATVEGGDAEELGTHLEGAGRTAEAAARYAEAALLAARRGDAATVLRASEKALSLGAPDEPRFALHAARADAMRFRGGRADRAAEIDAAVAAASSGAELAQALSERCVLLSRSGDHARALEVGARAVSEAEAADTDAVRVFAAGRLALAHIAAGDAGAAKKELALVDALTREAGPGLRRHHYEWQAQLAAATGDLGKRMHAFAEAARLHRELGDLRRAAGAESNLADVKNRVGAYGEAEKALLAARDACREVGHQVMEGYALLNLSYSLAMQGRVDEALARLEEAGALAADNDEAHLALLVRSYRARALLQSGLAEEARVEAALALDSAKEAGDRALCVATEALGAKAMLECTPPRLDDAEKASRRAHALCLELGGVEEDEVEVYLIRARVLSALGQSDEAKRVLSEGRARLDALSSGIADLQLRERFQRDVPAHREVLEALG